MPAEIGLATLGEPLTALITVDVTGEKYHRYDRLSNRWQTKHWTKIPFPYKGECSLDDARAIVKRQYLENRHRNCIYVAVYGETQKKFFITCDLLVFDLKDLKIRDNVHYYTALPPKFLENKYLIHLIEAILIAARGLHTPLLGTWIAGNMKQWLKLEHLVFFE
ncbi:hypothetical protein CDAR_597901 [Caerostris darwini]|uniref:Uncharacterized protein n=1 Tax=Caerostris darwini TaxID=1538125 RepID=A0AAV4QMV7_9ARAC|nr:hypothetical protein CDAR_597901 [Caerostris darwini]